MKIQRFSVSQRLASVSVGLSVLMTSIGINPALAGDPFRSNAQARPISAQTEAAFDALFKQGDYLQANQQIDQALKTDADEPLAYVIKAFLAYNQNDQVTFKRYASLVPQVAEHLKESDPLRGNLYQAVGALLQVGTSPGAAKGKVDAQMLSSIQQMFKTLDAAEAIAPNDPELNLVKGYIDVFLGLRFPLSSPQQAIRRLERQAAPSYVAQRGVAFAYKELKQPVKALAAVDRALQAAPGNPELLFLKAQILAQQGNKQASLALLETALEKKAQLPAPMVEDITQERDRLKASK